MHALLPLLLLPSLAAAGPAIGRSGTSIPITRRGRAGQDHTKYLRAQADALIAKYGAASAPDTKRANTGTEPLTNQNGDVTYYGTVAVGTPSQNFDVILDTGSSDLWLASSECINGCISISNTFDPSKSSTNKKTNLPIDIQYGSGEVAGDIVTDTVTLAGFTVQNQPLGVMNDLSAQIVGGSISGIMGLGWTALAQTGASPWWETLAKAGSFASPLFGFYLTRYGDQANVAEEEPGGSMDIGFINSSFSNINYVSLAAQTYWSIPLDTITIGGTQVKSGQNAAIDTGTTLLGGPQALMDELYSHIPGASPASGQLEGYYQYSCSQAPAVSLTFGGKAYTIEPSDFSLTVDTTGTLCVGAFFGINLGASSGVSWVIGDTFLKNVYSVFRYSPPAVGFQQLSSSSGGGGGASTTSSGSSTLSFGLTISGSSTSNASLPTTQTQSTSSTSSTDSTSSAEITSTFTVFVPPSAPTDVGSQTVTTAATSSTGGATQLKFDIEGTILAVLALVVAVMQL